MNINVLVTKWKFLLLVFFILFSVSSLLYTNHLAKEISKEEQKKIDLWAETYRLLNEASETDSNLNLYLQIIQNNTTIPVMIVDKDNKPKFWSNIKESELSDIESIEKKIERMKTKYDPIVLELYEGNRDYVYYGDSNLLIQLSYYPFIQLGIIFLSIGAAYFAFSYSRKSEQNQVWVGMSKETAHQLGTPISSLLAIIELLKMNILNDVLIDELEKDVIRLNDITERFSKIGSKPATPLSDIGLTIENSLAYIRKRSPLRVNICYTQSADTVMIPLSVPLFGWVIENICKNALDAIAGKGSIDISLKNTTNQVIIDISDTGKGIAKNKINAIFKPGYTSKSRGWGLGLTLAKRIIEEYHAGRIFVLRSEIDKGTTFRIVLKKDVNVILLENNV
jgi:hypothetical protein